MQAREPLDQCHGSDRRDIRSSGLLVMGTPPSRATAASSLRSDLSCSLQYLRHDLRDIGRLGPMIDEAGTQCEAPADRGIRKIDSAIPDHAP